MRSRALLSPAGLRCSAPLMIAVVVVVLGLVLAGCSSPTSETASDGGYSVGQSPDDDENGDDPAPEGGPVDVPAVLEFEATTLEGDSFDGASLAGTPTVMWFWAPWCPTCRAQISNVTELGETYAGEVAVVGVGALDSEEAIADLAADIPNLTHLVDPEGAVWRHFGVTAQSTYTVLDADGEVVSEGYLDDGELNDLVADLAAG